MKAPEKLVNFKLPEYISKQYDEIFKYVHTDINKYVEEILKIWKQEKEWRLEMEKEMKKAKLRRKNNWSKSDRYFKLWRFSGYKGDGKFGFTIGNGSISVYLVWLNIHFYF